VTDAAFPCLTRLTSGERANQWAPRACLCFKPGLQGGRPTGQTAGDPGPRGEWGPPTLISFLKQVAVSAAAPLPPAATAMGCALRTVRVENNKLPPPACDSITRMKIETKDIAIELEPELLTDEHLERVQRVINMALDYEMRRAEAEINSSAELTPE
jgi:hypothetical protein